MMNFTWLTVALLSFVLTSRFTDRLSFYFKVKLFCKQLFAHIVILPLEFIVFVS